MPPAHAEALALRDDFDRWLPRFFDDPADAPAVTPQGLTIRGEKREERKDTRANYRLVERRYGGFVRTMRLPAGLDLDRAEARVANGVLTVRIPKAPARRGRIPVQS
jgi:HSP20 family protein